MDIQDALKECLHREWGDTEEVRFILEAVYEYWELGNRPEDKREHEEKVNAAMKSFDSFISAIRKDFK